MTELRAKVGSSVVLMLFATTQAACSSSKPTHAKQNAAAPAIDDTGPLTFAETIEPLVQDKCQGCHHDGGIAPFPLVSYEDVKAMGAAAKVKVQAREMPPWGAFNDDSCAVNHALKNNLSLTDAQIDDFAQWVDKGMPLGDPKKRPPPRTTFDALGLPDKTGSWAPATPYTVSPGQDDIRCFPIDPGFSQDTWIGASNVVPGDPRVVHHVIVYIDDAGEGMKKAGSDTSYPCFGGPGLESIPSILLAWAPGVPPTTYGDDTGLKVSKGAQLIVQVHYHPNSETAADQTSVEVKALDSKPKNVAQVIILGNATSDKGILRLLPGPDDPASGPEFLIPSNVKGHTESMEVTIPPGLGLTSLGVYGAGAHMHWAGVDMKIEVERANPTELQPAKECLLSTPKYDFNWQRGYAYDEPFERLPLVSVGDTLRMTCTYDNTTGNRYIQREMNELRMSVPPEIHLGETTRDEMCLGVFVGVRRATDKD
jgi:hypothetical protein